MKVIRVCKAMNDAQRKLIINMDFGDVLRMKCSKLLPDLCKFLVECFDPNTSSLDFGARGRIPVTEQSVVRVMGVPMGTVLVPYHLDVDNTSLILEMFGVQAGRQPTVKSVEIELGPTYPADQVYMRKFIIYLMSSVFAPTSSTNVSPKCYPAVINTAAIRRLNWPRFIIDIFIQNANAKDKKTNWSKACMVYLMILYVDSLETDTVDVPEDDTRVCVWTNKLVKLVVDMDTNSDGSFGKLPLKACFRTTKVSLFLSDSLSVDRFIKHHVPAIQDEEVLAKYRGPVIDMCNVFEDGLAKFLISLTKKDANKAASPVKAQDDGNQGKQKPTRRRIRRRSDIREQASNEHQSEGVNIHDAPAATSENSPKKRKTSEEAIVDSMDVGKESREKGTAHPDQVDLMTPGHDNGTNKDNGDGTKPDCDSAKSFDQDGGRNQIVCMDPLKLLQCYGSGSKQTKDGNGAGAMSSHMTPTVPTKLDGKSKKSVSFLFHHNEAPSINNGNTSMDHNSPSMPVSPMKASHPELGSSCKEHHLPAGGQPVQGAANKSTPSPRRSARLAAAVSKASINTSRLHHADSPQPSEKSTMNRKLEYEGANKGAHAETEGVTKRKSLIDDYPSFDLGFDGPDSEELVPATEAKDLGVTLEELVIVSSNEDSGDSLDKIFAAIDMPTHTGNVQPLQEKVPSPKNPNSHTPVPQAHQKRVLRASKLQKSPYVDCEKKLMVSKLTNDIYIKVCSFGSRSRDALNSEKIIDYGDFYIYLWDLADAVRPDAWYGSLPCAPLTKLVKKAFECSPQNRLDHKEQIMFAVLQNLSPNSKVFTGHYYLIVLNLKAERFEIMDSLREEGNKGLMEDATKIIGSNKHLWTLYYNDSKFSVQNFKTVHIPTPRQKTTSDCGFFVLTFIERWDGRRMLAFNPEDMPNIRKLITKKWLEWSENKTIWQNILFKPKALTIG